MLALLLGCVACRHVGTGGTSVTPSGEWSWCLEAAKELPDDWDVMDAGAGELDQGTISLRFPKVEPRQPSGPVVGRFRALVWTNRTEVHDRRLSLEVWRLARAEEAHAGAVGERLEQVAGSDVANWPSVGTDSSERLLALTPAHGQHLLFLVEREGFTVARMYVFRSHSRGYVGLWRTAGSEVVDPANEGGYFCIAPIG